MLVVTLAAQAQPVFVDLRRVKGGRWELETAPEEEEEPPLEKGEDEEGEEEEEAEAPKKIKQGPLALDSRKQD
jgi:hypothetical protein